MRCPNIKHPDFVALKAKYGLKYSIYLYDQNGQEIPTLNEAQKLIENKRLNDPLFNEALMSTDNELSNFIMDTLQKSYPGIKLFKSRESFLDFVNKNGGDMNKVDIDTIGNAFKSSIYIDEENAVQSTYFHENAHIYWDALEDNNSIKKALIDLFSDEYVTQSETEEAIIRNIGIAGVSIAELELRGNKFQKFISLLQQFWSKVKAHLGIASKKDLVGLVANNVWTNKDKFNEKVFIENSVRNMNMNPLNIEIDDETHAFMNGDEMWTSVSRAIGMFSIFNEDEAANAMYERTLREKEENDDDMDDFNTFESREKFIKIQKNQWKLQAEVGTGLHSIAQSIVNNVPFSEIGDTTINQRTGSKISDYFSEEVLQDTYNKISKTINNMIEKGWTLHSEITVGSAKHKMAGIADIVMEKEGKLAVLDFKSFFEEDKADKKSGRYLKFPLETIQDTKENKHQLQVDIYANMVESQENKDVLFTAIVPFVYQMDNGIVESFETETAKIKYRKSKKSKIKDRNRKNADIVMNHVNKVQEIRKSLIMTDKELEELSKKSKIDLDLLIEQNESVKILTNMFGDLQTVPVQYVERILETGIEYMSRSMIDGLGYEHEDIFGDETKNISPMTAQDFVERHLQNKRPDETIDEVDYEDKKDFEKKILKNPNMPNRSDFGAKDLDTAYKRYVAERKVLEDIYENMEDISGIQKMKENNLDSVYRKVINMVSPEGKRLKEFIEGLKVSKLLTDRIKAESKEDYYGVKYATIYLGRMIRHPDRIFTDFKSYNVISQYFKNIQKIDKKHILVNLLAAELMIEHRRTVQQAEEISGTLQKYVLDSEDNGRSKNKKDRKQLKNEDFGSIMYTDEKTGFTYFHTPSKARSILEEKYGKEDSRPRNISRYLSELTSIMVKHDDILKSISRRKQPNIMVPELQQNAIEVFDEMSGANKIYAGRVHRLFGFKPYDNVMIRHKGEEKRLIDFKHKTYESIKEKNENNESISSDLKEMNILDRRAKDIFGQKKGKKRKTVFVIGKQTGRTILKTKNYNAAIQEYLASVIEARMMEKTIPIAEYTKSQYDAQGESAQNMVTFLEKEMAQKIYKNVEDRFKDHWFTRNVPGLLIAWTAKRTLGIGITTNIRNRGIGILWNWLQHPSAMANSFKRRFTNFGDKRNLLNKAFAADQFKKLGGIMKSTNIGTVMQDVTFSRYKNFMGKVNEIGFKPLEWTETFNQGELLRGLITEEEYNAYNRNGKPLRVYKGEILDPDTDRSQWSRKKQIEWDNKFEKSKIHPNVIVGNRANEIATVLSEVHGYFGFNKSQWSYHTLGRMIGMFTFSWAQATFSFMYSPKQTDSVGRVKKGLLNSLALNSKVLAYNAFKSTAKREDELEKIRETYYGGSGFNNRKEAEAKLYELDRFADPNEVIFTMKINGKNKFFVPGLDIELTDFERILAKKIEKDGKISGDKINRSSELEIIDRQNMVRLINLIVTLTGMYIIRYGIDDADDDIIYGEEYEVGGKKERGVPRNFSELTRDERFKHHVYQFASKNLRMLNEDLWFYANPEFYGGFFEAPPPASTLISLQQAGKSLIQSGQNDIKGYHVNPTIKHSYMEPKYKDQIISLIPYIAQPYKVAKGLYRTTTDAVYGEEIIKRADDMYENFRKGILSKSYAAVEVTDGDEDIEKVKKFISENRETIKNMYIDIEILNDIKKSEYRENEMFKKFYDYVKIYKKLEDEGEVERRLDQSISPDDIKERKVEFETQIK